MVDAPELPFARTAGPYERDVLAACYRMSGSVHDARELLRQTWQRAEREYADQLGPVRDWLKELAVEVSVSALAGRDSRPLPSGVRPASDQPEGDLDARHEVLWLEPIPDNVLGPAATGSPSRRSPRCSSSRLPTGPSTCSAASARRPVPRVRWSTSTSC